MIDISLDIETLDLSTNAVVLSVAATDGHNHFYEFLHLEEQILNLKRTMSASALTWWIEGQPEMFVDLLQRASKGDTTLNFFLNLELWFRQVTAQYAKPFTVWMNPPRFDGAVLENLANQCGTKLPWTFREEGDYRTLKNLAQQAGDSTFAIPPKPVNAHDALVDAKYQLEVIHICKTQLKC